MAKTKEELNALKEEMATLNEKLQELTDEELAQVAGGAEPGDGGLFGEKQGLQQIMGWMWTRR